MRICGNTWIFIWLNFSYLARNGQKVVLKCDFYKILTSYPFCMLIQEERWLQSQSLCSSVWVSLNIETLLTIQVINWIWLHWKTEEIWLFFLRILRMKSEFFFFISFLCSGHNFLLNDWVVFELTIILHIRF